MPLPFAIAGIPWLATVIGTAFSGMFAWFLSFMTKRLAIAAAAITLIVGLTGGLFAAVTTLLGALSLIVPVEMTELASLVLPGNMSLAFSICISVRLLRFAYDWNVSFIQMRLF